MTDGTGGHNRQRGEREREKQKGEGGERVNRWTKGEKIIRRIESESK